MDIELICVHHMLNIFDLPSFPEIAKYLHDPFVLFGFFLYCGLIIMLAIIRGRMVSATDGYKLISKLLNYGLIILLLLIGFVFGLKYLPLKRTPPQRAQLLAEASPMISAVVNFRTGNSIKKPTTGFRVYLFDNQTLGRNYINGLNRNPPAITSEVCYVDQTNQSKAGTLWSPGKSVDLTLELRKNTTSSLMEDGVLFVWIFPTEPNTWQFTPTLILKFQDPRLDTAIKWQPETLNEKDGYREFSFSLR